MGQKELDVAKREIAAAKLRTEVIQGDLANALQENKELKAGASADESRLILVRPTLTWSMM